MKMLRSLSIAFTFCWLATAASSCADSDDGQKPAADAIEMTAGEISGCIEGEPCDDGDECTGPDECTNGQCTGGDAVPCEEYSCADSGCNGLGGCIVPVIHEGWCLVEGQCVVAGETAPDNPCLVCKPDKSATDLVPVETGTSCEDANICTENDFCDSGDCLPGSPPTCADGIQCTVDACDPDSGCLHEIDHDVCDDDNACTADSCDPEASIKETGCVNLADDNLSCADGNVCTVESCEDGVCMVDAEPISCDDDNICTDETCHESYGCLYVFNDLGCDDGANCTNQDTCHFGLCFGVEDWWNSCPPCDETFSDHVQKIISLRVGDCYQEGAPYEALNIDSDLKTCSPDCMCEVGMGLDNSLMLAGDFIDETIAQNLVDPGGDTSPLIFLTELVEPDFDGTEFAMNIYYGGLSWDNPDCDFMQDKCIYQASSLSFNVLCEPQVAFDNAKIENGVLTAGGSGFIFPFKATFSNGATTETVLYAARVRADMVTDSDGNILSLKGVMGGAITKENLVDLIMAIPDQYLPLEKEAIVGLVENIPQDIDLDGDGSMDGSSIALVFETIPGILEPYYK